MILGVSDNHKPDLDNYTLWVERVLPVVEWLKLSHVCNNADDLERCEGLILTGGGDIHPKSYGRPDAIGMARNVSEERDSFECEIARRALERGLPVLGICRGMQLFNVALGGDLIPDLKTDGYMNHRKVEPGKDRFHTVEVVPETLLHEIVSTTQGHVNSSHHQAVGELGKGLRVSARSVDSVIEAAEWEDGSGRPFLLLVQWHPERMNDVESPFSRGVLERFLYAVEPSVVNQMESKRELHAPYHKKGKV
jgi:putative glutamine amidotransferase